MYSISSLTKSCEAHQPSSSLLRPDSKAQTITLAIEAIAALAITGLGAYLLLHHGVDISHVGTLGTNAGYLCLCAPGAFLLADYLVGTAIKNMKSHRANEKEKTNKLDTEIQNKVNEQEKIANTIRENTVLITTHENLLNECIRNHETENRAEIEKKLEDLREKNVEDGKRLNALNKEITALRQ